MTHPNFSIHPIKSYTRRERFSAHQHTLFNTLFPFYGVPLTGLIQPSSLFKRSAQTHVEIGFGMGETLIETACRHPEWNILGIEVYHPGIVNVLRIVHSKKLTNVRIICEDAALIFANHLPPKSIHGIEAYFPDPWPKRRHHKRRLFQPAFVHQIEESLEESGWVHIVTDWTDYAKEIARIFEGFNRLDLASHLPPTKFQTKANRAGRAIHEFFFEKPRPSRKVSFNFSEQDRFKVL